MFRFGTRLLVVTGALLLALGVSAAEQSDRSVVKGSKAYELDSCVEPTPVMRKLHPTFIKHQRDITVHQGIRGAKHSLSGCVDCHAAKDAQGKYTPVNAPGQFCESCHEYAGVEIPCFSCHATTPTGRSGE